MSVEDVPRHSAAVDIIADFFGELRLEEMVLVKEKASDAGRIVRWNQPLLVSSDAAGRQAKIISWAYEQLLPEIGIQVGVLPQDRW